MPKTPPHSLDDPRTALRARLESIVADPERVSSSDRIVFVQAGGPPGARYERTLQILGDGTGQVQHMDELASPKQRTRKKGVPPGTLHRLFRTIRESDLVSFDSGQGFLPDSLIGMLTIQIEDAQMTHYFLADEEQRRDQKKPLPEPLRKIVTMLDDVAKDIEASESSDNAVR